MGCYAFPGSDLVHAPLFVENWNKRKEIVNYCVEVMDKSIEAKSSESPSGEPSYAERVKVGKLSLVPSILSIPPDPAQRKQIYNELTVESIVRQRSIDGTLSVHYASSRIIELGYSYLAFKARCKYFEPPLTDVEARAYWNSAYQKR